jgi:Ca-activated chloride channel family protein
MYGIDFANPHAFALWPALLILKFFTKRTPQRDVGIMLPSSMRDKLQAMTAHTDKYFFSWRLTAVILAWTGIILGFSGPRITNAVAALPISGRDLVLSIDLSGSMTKRDFDIEGVSVSRLELVKKVASELVRRREGDRIGLVIFAEKALAAAPMSFDTTAIARSLEEMEVGLVGRSTAIGEGLGLALKRLTNSIAPTRIVILLSDGANNAGSSDPVAVADLARRLGVRVFTIGLGVEDTITHPESRDAVDFVALQKVANIGGGAAFRARSGAELDQVMKMIESMVASTALAPPSVIYSELWIYPVIVALFSCIFILMRSRALR